jgi:threonine dehydrogenase-like Zn-dependent dehydrogenase
MSHDEARQEEPSMLVFDFTGDCGSMEQSIQLLQQVSLFDPDLHRREATILASRNSNKDEHHRTLELMESGRIDISGWPTECAPRSIMHERIPAWLHKEAGVAKAVVDWS